MTLREYYTVAHIDKALPSYCRAVPESWTVSHRLDMYEHAKLAFESGTSHEDRFRAFQYVYSNLKRWGVFRNAAGKCWDAVETYVALTSKGRTCSRLSSLTALNLYGSHQYGDVLSVLSHLGPMKPLMYENVYPWMAVSKILHFYNPRLFPIYDGEFIWKRAANRTFKHDYREFCWSNDFDPFENGSRINLQYSAWASHVMQGADPAVMIRFAQWFQREAESDGAAVSASIDLATYYATAFEMIALGAKYAERCSRHN
jgi:hypothetical protein